MKRGHFDPLISLLISRLRFSYVCLRFSYVCLRGTFRGILEGYFDEKNDCSRSKFSELIYNMKFEESKMLEMQQFKILKKLQQCLGVTLQYNFHSYNSEGDIYSSNLYYKLYKNMKIVNCENTVSVTSHDLHTLPLSQTVTLSQTPSPLGA